MLIRDRFNEHPKYDPSFPLRHEYVQLREEQFAREWCEKEGYEWYDDREEN